MRKKEYIVFAAFLLINGMLALNCFTYIVFSKRNKISDSNYEEEKVVIRNNKPNFPNSYSTLVPGVIAIWNNKNQLQISFLSPSVYHFCIQIENQRNDYKNSDIKDCEEVQEKPHSSFYQIETNLINNRLKEKFFEVTELVINTKYPNDLVFLLKDSSYILINSELELHETNILNLQDSFLKKFLDNKDNTIQRQKINTMFEIKFFRSEYGYVYFQNLPNKKNRIISIEWYYKEIIRESKIPEFILWTLILPATLILDLFMAPITVPLILAYMFLK